MFCVGGFKVRGVGAHGPVFGLDGFEVSGVQPIRLVFGNVGASIGFGGIIYYNHSKEPPKPHSND